MVFLSTRRAQQCVGLMIVKARGTLGADNDATRLRDAAAFSCPVG
ncbi:hypothetical protein PATSB16_16290 [Pandoraea thiooxydans]|nr:hypothetical protein PATSB16_16290 [Pandoraea thiooxydans]